MDLDNKTAFELSHAFRVSQADLYNAFIDPATLKEIWGVSSITIDARPGGRAAAKLTIENENWDFVIVYQEVAPHQKLQWTVHFDRFPGRETRAALSFKATSNGSEVAIRLENFATSQERDANKRAWEGAVGRLEAIFYRSGSLGHH